MKQRLLLCVIATTFYAISFAQTDAEDCKDHPLFNRMSNYVIDNCSQNFDAIELPVSDEKTQHVEGTITKIRYVFNEDSKQKMPSFLQISRNYENAFASNGGKKIFYGMNPPTETAINSVIKGNVNGKNVWVALGEVYEPETQGEIGGYSLWVIEEEAMKQEINANDIYESLNTSGKATLYINFETGKSDINAEAEKVVSEIATMMKNNPSLKISIEGHTDNAGNAASNKTLSEKRANAIMNAIVAKGISKERLTAKGWGQEKPIADNSTEDGRAKNRRVELIKM